MRNLIIAVVFLTGFITTQNPKDITGKWLVETVDASKMTAKLTKQQKEVFNKQLVAPLTNAVFDFKPDHHFYLSPGLQYIPQNDYWEYDNENGIVTITEYNNHKAMLMKIGIIEKDGNTFFVLQETSVVLKVHKKES